MVTDLRILFTAKQKDELWERWKNGQSVLATGDLLEHRRSQRIRFDAGSLRQWPEVVTCCSKHISDAAGVDLFGFIEFERSRRIMDYHRRAKLKLENLELKKPTLLGAVGTAENANRDLAHCSKQQHYSINSSARASSAAGTYRPSVTGAPSDH